MNVCQSNRDNINKTLEQKASHKLNIYISKKVDTMKRKHHINRTNTLPMLMLMTCFIVEKSAEKP